MNELIQQAREMCEIASDGPWENGCGYVKDQKGVMICNLMSTRGDFGEENNNADFIVASRILVPQLCDALEAAQKEIAGLQKQIDTITGGYDYYANRSQQFENAAKEWAAENKRLTSRAEKAEAERDTYKAALEALHINMDLFKPEGE
ncbi:hypothetical protein DSECCO2_396970 [anaerobic digester metagenome]